jgi:hypothetical protein
MLTYKNHEGQRNIALLQDQNNSPVASSIERETCNCLTTIQSYHLKEAQ